MKDDFKRAIWTIFWGLVIGAVVTALSAALATYVVKLVWYS